VAFLAETLNRVRGAFRRRATRGRHARTDTPQEAPQAPRTRLTPAVLGARLVTARRHRAERAQGDAWQPKPQGHAEWFPPADWERTGALVRPYVAALGETPRNVRAGAQGAPWGRRVQ
jgi:hypothetical protein